MNFDDSGAGPAGIELLLPAALAAPPPAEHALAEFRYRVGCTAQVADKPGKAPGLL